MGKYFVSPEASTPANDIRETLSEAEKLLANLRKAGPQVVELLRLFDEITEALDALEADGMDVRAERSRFETVKSQLDNRKGRFLTQAGKAFIKAREAAQPSDAWWWYIDEALVEERKQKRRRVLTTGAVVVGVLIVVGVVYQLFLAPPPEVRQAMRYDSRGKYLVRDERDLEAALIEFEAAHTLVPTNPDYLVWIGVLRSELGDTEAGEEAFASAHALYETNGVFLLRRAEAYREVGNLEIAIADIDQAIDEDPEWGWAYYARHTIHIDMGDYRAALEDLEMADELARESGDDQLAGMARVQQAMVMQMLSSLPAEATPTPTPTP
jgi:tetratricopeptide (TPR) repeat protein